MIRVLLFLLLALPVLAQPSRLQDVTQAMAQKAPEPAEWGQWLKVHGFVVEGDTVSLDRGTGPRVALWMTDQAAARSVLRALYHLNWKGTLIARVGADSAAPPPESVELFVASLESPTLPPGDVALPRSEFRSHVDVVTIDIPAGPNVGAACAEVLLALRTDLVDPFDDAVLHVEKFSVKPSGQLVVSLKTYDNETRQRFLVQLDRLVKGAAPDARITIPHQGKEPEVGIDWTWRVRKVLGQGLGVDKVLLEAPVEDSGAALRAAAAWTAPAVVLWWSPSAGPLPTALALAEILDAHR